MKGIFARFFWGVGWVSTKTGHLFRMLALASSSPDTLVSCNRLGFDAIYGIPVQSEKWDFFDEEQKLLEHLDLKPGKVLCCGAGTGREVFAFQRLGFEAVGVEQVDKFVEHAVSHAKENNIPVTFIEADLVKFDYVSHFQEKSFDCVTIFNVVYSYIPSRKRRINLLRQMRQILKPDGHCLVNFVMIKPSLREQRWSPFIRIFGKMMNWRSEFEIGDRLHEGVPIYRHNFPSYEAVEKEALDAGFRQVEFFNFLGNGPHAVLSGE